MRFLTKSEIASRFEGKTVAVVGSGPGSLDNKIGFIDGHDVVVRINNYKLLPQTGRRTDVFYSFFGASIKKTADELKRDGVTLCMCKCPDSQPIESEWHLANDKMNGVDFRPIYRRRAQFWFCDVHVPTDQEFLVAFNLLDRHIPTTGFSAILDVLGCRPSHVYLTGFDFFASGIHNVNERWHHKNSADPIGHVPQRELEWLGSNAHRYPISCDPTLTRALRKAANTM